ncbi:two-component system, NtrC family, response regulator AtoC [Desulfonatronum zhilinae]|nr:two-component system, NtrC family, response regulator AtoC [Desulfonatronum zhilinae]
MEPMILVVDDEQDFLDSVRRSLALDGLRSVELRTRPESALELFSEPTCPVNLVLLDVSMPEMSGLELLGRIKETHPEVECVMISALDEAETAVACLKAGAYDYLVKPVSRDALLAAVRRALERGRLLKIANLDKGRRASVLSAPFQTLITRCPAMLRLLREAELHAASDVPVLITGETGTGKELLARAMHQASPRAEEPFIPVNMNAVSRELFVSEFFGHVRGAFTGAVKDRPGLLETCHRGTLFLDEIGDLPLDFQGKLLRVLQDGEFFKLGSDRPQRVDVRIVAATNVELEERIAVGLFRRDLYYRLNCARLHLPRLAERKKDIPVLVERFLTEKANGSPHSGISGQAMDALLAHDYPGNIRELRSILHAAWNTAQNRLISPADLPAVLRSKAVTAPTRSLEHHSKILADVEQEHILAVYRENHRNKARSAKVLGIGLNTLRRKLVSYGVE